VSGVLEVVGEALAETGWDGSGSAVADDDAVGEVTGAAGLALGGAGNGVGEAADPGALANPDARSAEARTMMGMRRTVLTVASLDEVDTAPAR
jgi:hypothetical protein